MKKGIVKKYGKEVEMYYFDSRFFESGGKRYEIVGTIINGGGIMDAEHRIKGENETKTMKHEELVKLYKSGKLKTL